MANLETVFKEVPAEAVKGGRMKKLIGLVAVAVLLVPSIASALTFDEYVNMGNYKIGLTSVKDLQLTAGFSYSVIDSCYKPIFTKPVAEYKDFTVAWGHNANDALVGTLTYNIVSLKEDLGVTIPVLDMIRLDVGVMGGWKRVQAFSGTGGNNEWDCGFAATLIKKTF